MNEYSTTTEWLKVITGIQLYCIHTADSMTWTRIQTQAQSRKICQKSAESLFRGSRRKTNKKKQSARHKEIKPDRER